MQTLVPTSLPHSRMLQLLDVILCFTLRQIWDFESARPLEMRKNEACTASCMMSDGERMVLARTERYGGAATVIIWDVLGNEPVRRLVYESPVGFVDQISYVCLLYTSDAADE